METPNSIEDVAIFIQGFYARNGEFQKPEAHAEADKILFQLQRSPQGFKIADQLLSHDDKGVRFFGASTFYDKIENGLDELSDDEKQELLDRVVSWYIAVADKGNDNAVLGRLTACLVQYFMQMEGGWKDCTMHLLASLVHGKPTATPMPEDLNLIKQATHQLSENRQTGLYTFLEAFSQEVYLCSTTSKARKHRDEVMNNMPVISKLVEYVTDNALEINDEIAWQGTKAYSNLIIWAKEALGDPDKAWIMLRPILESFVGAVLGRVDILEMVTDILCDLLTDVPSFLKPEHHNMILNVLLSPQSDAALMGLAEGIPIDTVEHITFGKLLLTYSTSCIDNILTNQQRNGELLERVLRVTNCKGVAILEDDFIPQVVEFWSTLCEALEMFQFASEGSITAEHWLTWNNELLPRLANSLILKGRLPSTDQMKTWSEDEKARFTELRTDIGHLLNSLYELLGPPLINHIVSMVWKMKAAHDWNGVEALLNCLNSIVDNIDGNEVEDKAASAILDSGTEGGSSLLEMMGNEEIPLALRRKTIAFIDSYAEVFNRHEVYMPAALNFLSNCLQVSHSLAALAAKSISTLCLRGRVKMTSILGNLFTLYEGYTNLKHRETTVHERLVSALSAVVQASAFSLGPQDDWRASDALGVLNRLIDTIDADVKQSCRLLNLGAQAQATELNLSALSCLRSMGKAFREPDTVVIDIEEDGATQPENVWAANMDLTQSLQSKILGICSESLSSFSGSEEIEAVCQILRAGYTESRPGPFVFPLSATEAFVKQCTLATSRIGMVLETAAVILNKHKTSRNPEVNAFAMECLKHVRGMVMPFFDGNPSKDPEVASIVIDFLLIFLPRYTDCLLNEHEIIDLRHTFDFTIACLRSNEIMPKRSAAAFWAALVRDTGAHSGCGDKIEDCLSEYGQRLSGILVHQIGGGASRSELDDLCEPIKALAFRGGKSQIHFKRALRDLQVERGRVSATDKSILTEQILKLRGGSRTNKIIKDFWAACRGTFAM